MKNILNKVNSLRPKILTLLASLLLLPIACTDLEEEVFSEVTESSFVPSESDIISVMASAYTPMRFVMGWQGYFDLQEEPGDMFVTPTRPNGWDDGGTYKRMHFHEWTETQWQPRNTWIRAGICHYFRNESLKGIVLFYVGGYPWQRSHYSKL